MRCDSLSATERQAMFALAACHFPDYPRECFARDVANKHWVVLAEDGQEQICGFSTLRILDLSRQLAGVAVAYSGDTILLPHARTTRVLWNVWTAAMRHVHQVHAGCGRRLYWAFMTLTHRSYRFLPLFTREFHPRYDAAAPPEVQAILDLVGRSLFHDQYDPFTGLVRPEPPQVLRRDLLNVAHGARQDPHVRFFLDRNPGYVRGDGLLCLAELTESNLTAAGLRFLHHSLPFQPPAPPAVADPVVQAQAV